MGSPYVGNFPLQHQCKCGDPPTRVLVTVKTGKRPQTSELTMVFRCDLCARTMEAVCEAEEGRAAKA